jgi:3-oxoadipate enol-lactonase
LLHGWAITADFNFCHVMGPVGQQFGVVAMDLPGHGRGVQLSNTERFSITQCAEDAAAALDVLGITRVVVCGYSVGGPVAMEFVRLHRNRVAGLVLEATALALDDVRSTIGRVVFRGLRPLADHSHGFGRSLPLRYYNRVRARDRQTASWWPWLRGELIGCHPRVIVDAILARYAFDFRSQVESLAGVPTAVVVTTRDRAVPPGAQREMALLLDAPVIELDADHDVFLTRPASYVEATLAAIDCVTGQS